MAAKPTIKFPTLIVALVLLVLLGGAYWAFISLVGIKSYVAVYTVTGDLYFGEERPYPYQALRNVHLLQQSQNQQQPSLQAFENALWQPKGDLMLNEENVVWRAELSPESRIVQFFKGELQPQQQAPQQFQGQPSGSLPQQQGASVPQGAPSQAPQQIRQ